MRKGRSGWCNKCRTKTHIRFRKKWWCDNCLAIHHNNDDDLHGVPIPTFTTGALGLAQDESPHRLSRNAGIGPESFGKQLAQSMECNGIATGKEEWNHNG